MSYVPIAVLVLGLPIPLALSRLLAARRDRLKLGLLRQPVGRNLLPHRLQFVNAFDFPTGVYRAVLIAFVGGCTPFRWSSLNVVLTRRGVESEPGNVDLRRGDLLRPKG